VKGVLCFEINKQRLQGRLISTNLAGTVVFWRTMISLFSQISIFYFAASCFAAFGLPDYI